MNNEYKRYVQQICAIAGEPEAADGWIQMKAPLRQIERHYLKLRSTTPGSTPADFPAGQQAHNHAGFDQVGHGSNTPIIRNAIMRAKNQIPEKQALHEARLLAFGYAI